MSLSRSKKLRKGKEETSVLGLAYTQSFNKYQTLRIQFILSITLVKSLYLQFCCYTIMKNELKNLYKVKITCKTEEKH